MTTINKEDTMELMKEKKLFKKHIFKFLEELDSWSGPEGSYLALSEERAIIELNSFEIFKFNPKLPKIPSPRFEMYLAVEDEEFKWVILETFLARYYDVEVEDLIIQNLENFRIVYDRGNAHVGVIITHPKDFIGEIVKLMLFCNIYIQNV